MDRRTWAIVVTYSVVVLLAATLASCGNGSTAQNKRLTDQGPCDLAKVEELEAVFGPVDDPPHQEGPQCFYDFENGHPAIGRAADAARHGTSFEIDGVAAKKFEKNGTCAIDVWLVPNEINQQFGVVVIGSCDPAITVARMVLNNLPEGE